MAEEVEKIADDMNRTHMSDNILVRTFFRVKTQLAVNMAGLKRGDVVLDFGCGSGYLKNKLKSEGHNALGYDITPEHSDVKDYRTLKPNKILSLDVLEHIPKEEIRKIIEDFKKMNDNFYLVLAIPTENFLSRKMRRLFGKPERVPDHVTTLKEIVQIMKDSGLEVKRKLNYFTITHLYLFRFENQ